MPRIAADDIQKRETFLLDLFVKDPAISAQKANEALKAKFGSAMRPSKVFELKRTVKQGIVKPEVENVTRARPAKAVRKQRIAKRDTEAVREEPVAAPEVAVQTSGADYLVLTGSRDEISNVIRFIDVLIDAGSKVTVSDALTKSVKSFTQAVSG